MAFTNGSLYGLLEGNTTGTHTNSAFNSCNTTNPNYHPANDYFQILAPGGKVLFNVDSTGTAHTAPTSPTKSTVVATVQMTEPQYKGLASTPTAAQITAAAFPLNYAKQQLDIFQVATDIASPTVRGGGGVIFRLRYNGAIATS